jgi:hypothetical protein
MQFKTVCSLTLAAAMLVPSGAWARHHKAVHTVPSAAWTTAPVAISIAELRLAPPAISVPVQLEEVALTDIAVSPASRGPAPSVLEPLRRLSCVPYARLRSGLQIFGDARLWWEKATSLYAQLAKPVAEAVMVFSGGGRLKRGHVAVVTEVLNSREIKVDHANWQNHGEIDLNMPVLDVSRDNDWSRVRVWNVNTNSFGTHVYPISGFITRSGAKNLAP